MAQIALWTVGLLVAAAALPWVIARASGTRFKVKLSAHLREDDAGEPGVSVHTRSRVEHRKAIRFGTKPR